MAFSKQHLYNPNDQITAGYAHAFSHAARILIVKQLITIGPSTVQVIANDHPIHKESMSDHIKVLRHFDLVQWEERFPYTFYSAHLGNLRMASKYLSDFLEKINSGV
jgi:predicted transcriptional regulator